MSEARFWKLCGSGTGQGFTPRPNTRVWAILAIWDSLESARRMMREAPIYRRWKNMSDENWTVYLGATSARGEWSGKRPFEAVWPGPEDTDSEPIAALTRATIKPGALPHFWNREPDISRAIGDDPNVLFKIGIGEVPFFHQVTFSIWPDSRSMANFARKDGPHARAIKAVRDGAWFKEELYARFRILGSEGTWRGQSPISCHERHAA